MANLLNHLFLVRDDSLKNSPRATINPSSRLSSSMLHVVFSGCCYVSSLFLSDHKISGFEDENL